MEHRCTARFPVRLKVKVSYQGKGLGVHITRDLSLFGVFLEQGLVNIPSDRILDLTILVKKSSNHEMSATVVRQEVGGLGLMFVEDGYPRNVNLNGILSEAPRPKRSEKEIGSYSPLRDF